MIHVRACESFTEVIMPQRSPSSRLMHTRIKQTRLMSQLCRQRKHEGSHNFHLTQHPLCLPPPSSYLCQIRASPPLHTPSFLLFILFFFIFFKRADSICTPTRWNPMNPLGGAECRCISHICTCSLGAVCAFEEWMTAGRQKSLLSFVLTADRLIYSTVMLR